MTSPLTRQSGTRPRSTDGSPGGAEYKVVIYQEGMLGSLLLGSSKVDPVRFGEFLNMNAREGWRVVTMEKDMRRMLLFWKREAYVVILERAP